MSVHPLENCTTTLIEEHGVKLLVISKHNCFYYYRHDTMSLHREGDLPAIIEYNTKKWYRDGQLHRENDLPAIIDKYHKRWFLHGNLHRENDLPAIDHDGGSKEWYYHGKQHRLTGPAQIDSDGSEYWYYNDKFIYEVSSQEEFEQYLKLNVFT